MCAMEACRGTLLVGKGNHHMGCSGDRGRQYGSVKKEQNRITPMYENANMKLITLYGHINREVR